VLNSDHMIINRKPNYVILSLVGMVLMCNNPWNTSCMDNIFLWCSVKPENYITVT